MKSTKKSIRGTILQILIASAMLLALHILQISLWADSDDRIVFSEVFFFKVGLTGDEYLEQVGHI